MVLGPGPGILGVSCVIGGQEYVEADNVPKPTRVYAGIDDVNVVKFICFQGNIPRRYNNPAVKGR